MISSFACDDKSASSLSPFAKELVGYSSDKTKQYEINFPIQDGKFFLNGISVQVPNQFRLAIEYSENSDIDGGYYSAHIAVSDSVAKNLDIVGSYNGLNKEGTSFVLCGNFKHYNLSQLLSTNKTK
jgi:hypothetical protein